MSEIYLILGGNGALGVPLVQYLLLSRPGARIIAVGRNPEKPAAFSFHKGIDDSRYEYHQIHLARETNSLLDLIQTKQPHFIINLAAQSESAASWKEAWTYFETNDVALAKLVEPLTNTSWLKKWVQVSSSEVYGSIDFPVTEETPVVPASPYSASKIAADYYLLALHRAFQFPVNIMRPSTVYGPGQQLHRIIPKTILCALLDRKLPLQGGGKTVKSFLHTKDFSRALVLAAEREPVGQVYNVGPTEGTSVRRVVEMIAEKTRVPFNQLTEIVPGRSGHDTQSLVDCSRIRKDLDWNANITLEQGLEDVIMWTRKNLDFLKMQPTTFQFQE